MKKTFISDLKKFNNELGNYYLGLINNEYNPEIENINELLYSFFLGRMFSLNDINLIFQTASKALKPVLKDYFDYFNSEVKLDICPNLLDSFNNENVKQTNELLNQKNIKIDEENFKKFINEILEIRKKALPFCGNDSKYSNEVSDTKNAIIKLYNDILKTSVDFKVQNKDLENDFISITINLADSYLYFDDLEKKELRENLEINLKSLTRASKYEKGLEIILKYYSPLKYYDLDNLIRVNINESISYNDFLNLLFSKIDYSLFEENYEEIKTVIKYLSYIYINLTNKIIEEDEIAIKEKEYLYKLLLSKIKKYDVLNDSYEISKFIINFFNLNNCENLEEFFYSFFKEFIFKFNIVIKENFSDLFLYLINLFNSATDYYLFKNEIIISNLDGKKIEEILIDYLNINFINETLCVKSDKLGLSDHKKKNKDVHKKFKELTKELDLKFKSINKCKKSNGIIVTNLYLFYDYYISLISITKSRSTLTRIKELGIVKGEKKYINNYIDALANLLLIDKDFLKNKFNSQNVEDEIVLYCKQDEYNKFKVVNDELLKLKLNNIIVYKYQIIN